MPRPSTQHGDSYPPIYLVESSLRRCLQGILGYVVSGSVADDRQETCRLCICAGLSADEIEIHPSAL